MTFLCAAGGQLYDEHRSEAGDWRPTRRGRAGSDEAARRGRLETQVRLVRRSVCQVLLCGVICVIPEVLRSRQIEVKLSVITFK